ncbi:MAG TPA: UDP-N-acetylmuramoyl-L-alanyl-D-glutamate--2,6-diaminopimelate ligase [Acidimicrobiaceae bacterium]|nr:UDP-N-acetylmuramoyl-L-alanyl-D-glutamate--2,6-diaminopimelate ligase [Acidimicrobiaceae bacterium]
MRLATIVAELNEVEMVGLSGSPSFDDLEITDVNFDSRQVRAGSLFCCVPGVSDDGHLHAGDAISAGAVALLVDHRVDVDVPQLVVANVREAMATVSATCFGRPAEDLLVVGVTGTNGKTTTTWMLRNIFTAARRNVEVLGTLSGARTTPESPDLQRRLAEWRDDGVEIVAMEVSSHAIDQCRVDAMKFRVALFTNLSRDHLDYHGSMEEYFETKARLFDPERCESAVVNLDSPHGRLLADAATVPTDGYSLDEVEELQLSVDGSTFRWMGHQISLPLGGLFNVSNALGAAHAARVLGVDDATIAEGLSLPLVVEGRFERVDAGQPFAIIVDYAHTPDGLEQLLRAAGEIVEGRVIVVFGCGGDRDPSKRSMMGETAAQRADSVIITADNSRSESTDQIIASIVEGVQRVSSPRASSIIVEPDRRTAISMALRSAVNGDIVLLAGKGHETVQIIGESTTPFDDRLVAFEEWKQLEAAR